MRKIKKSIFVGTMLAVMSMGTGVCAQTVRKTGQVENTTCCAIAQYEGNYVTLTARLSNELSEYDSNAMIDVTFSVPYKPGRQITMTGRINPRKEGCIKSYNTSVPSNAGGYGLSEISQYYNSKAKAKAYKN